MLDGTLRLHDNGGFDVAKSDVESFECCVSNCCYATIRPNRLMLTTGIGDVTETGQPIADDGAR